MTYHTDPLVNDLVLTIVNDGNGSECGMTYKQRCDAADTGLSDYIVACKTYAQRRVNVYECDRLADRKQVRAAAECIQEYYRNHMKVYIPKMDSDCAVIGFQAKWKF